ncbi:hypothetical protein LOTGIDRAFT_181978 [Lottia gigantea]|uniref:Anaphase-promoting complex subunit 7 n=1 Tax=Lottia gigantea TaxID=225164 RepID=V4C885_LOTGI|nr:hypothetical protein LOTGIDRAFT_181978 [Lottia gigantea]ESO97919.1 hypothetical protein LOTGIDRAFT_181978 [Lottia gigantea]
MTLFDNIKQLYQSELFGELKQLVSVVLTLCDNNTEAELLSPSQKYQCLVYLGDSLLQLAEYKKSEFMYRKALVFKKTINKTKGKCGTVMDITSDVEVKCRLYNCLTKMDQDKEALNVLESINSKQRNSKVNSALAKLYLKDGRDRSAITCYKEVVREHPMALEAINGLLSLGMKSADVEALVMNSLPHGTNYDWLTIWIKGHSYLAAKEYPSAVSTLKLMESKLNIKDCVPIISAIGEARFYDGNYHQAMLLFQRVRALDPFYMKNLDLYAYILAREKKFNELQGLAHELIAISETVPESWIALGYSSLICPSRTRDKLTRALYFGVKAFNFKPKLVEALLLKGSTLVELKKTQDAIFHFQEVVRLAPHRFEAYQGLINCYMITRRNKDAISWCGRAMRTLGNSARTFTLSASVLAKDPNTITKAKLYLERSMRLDPNYVEAVYITAEILMQEKAYQQGIDILKKQLSFQSKSTARLHQLLGDFLAQVGSYANALVQYHSALEIDPNCSRAKKGIERVEKQNVDLETDTDAEDMRGSDNDIEFEGSDVDSTWSEAELN